MQARIELAAIDAVMVVFDAEVSLKVNRAVHDFAAQLTKLNPSWLRDIVPAYHCLMVVYDIHQTTAQSVTDMLLTLVQQQPAKQDEQSAAQQHRFLVCYEAEFAPDLQRVAQSAGLSTTQVIAHHSEREYHVYTVGFAPGFAYLGDVHSAIQTPRLATPRTKVPAGSVAIANQQTAIYPRTSPGGWNIIGQVANWRVEYGLAIKAGDTVRFEPISALAFRDYVNDVDGHHLTGAS